MDATRIVGTPDSKLKCACGSLLLGEYEAIVRLDEEVGDHRFGDAGTAVAWTTMCSKCDKTYIVTAPEGN